MRSTVTFPAPINTNTKQKAFVGKANETTLNLFKKDQIYITEYIETNEMTYDHKMLQLLEIIIQLKHYQQHKFQNWYSYISVIRRLYNG